MLRHSRAMTRHHRERIIRKKKQLIEATWSKGWPEDIPEGRLSKTFGMLSNCRCGCYIQRSKRSKFDWKREIAQQYDQ